MVERSKSEVFRGSESANFLSSLDGTHNQFTPNFESDVYFSDIMKDSSQKSASTSSLSHVLRGSSH